MARSWAILERSRETSGLPILFLLKTLIPVFAVMLALQGIAQAIRAASVLADGALTCWPKVSRSFSSWRSACCCSPVIRSPSRSAGCRSPSRPSRACSVYSSFRFLAALPQRIFGVMTNEVLLAIPLFIFMGVMLERSRIAEDLLETMGRLFGPLRGGLGISVTIVGVLLAAAKGVVGATTVTMGLIVLPAMLRYGYDQRLAAGIVAATATLAQIFPPATVLVLLGDQLEQCLSGGAIVEGDFLAAIGDGQRPVRRRASFRPLRWSALYILYLIAVAIFFPQPSPADPARSGAPRGLALSQAPARCWWRRSS